MKAKEDMFRRRSWVLVLGSITAMTLFSTSLLYVSYNSVKGHPMNLTAILTQQTLWWYPWLPVFPFIVFLANRFPIHRNSWQRSLLVHLAGGLTASVIHLSLYVLIAYLFGGQLWKYVTDKPGVGYFEEMGRLLTTPFMVNYRMRILIYLIVVMVTYAVDYYQRFEKREVEAAKLRVQLGYAQLQALRMQLHPHFLFNTLNSVSALLYKDVSAAQQMIQKLINFLNLTLEDSGAQEVTLQKELDFLKNYLQIEQIRFQDRLNVEMQIEPEVLHALVPHLIMQPIVENAIRHGIAPRANPGKIEIRASRINGTLQIVVQDNGPGLPRTFNGDEFREGVGLSNTRLRLKQIYGNDCKVDLANREEGGVHVTLELPYHNETITN